MIRYSSVVYKVAVRFAMTAALFLCCIVSSAQTPGKGHELRLGYGGAPLGLAFAGGLYYREYDPGYYFSLDRFRDYPVRLFPVGRLDYDSEGILLLSNDGDMMNRVLHPSFEIKKVYLVRVSNQVTDAEIAQLRKGVIIDGRMTSPSDVRLTRRDAFSTDLLITIHEGRNRQVRKMIDAIGHQVVHLKRVQFGPVILGDLPSGMWRKLTEEEIRKLVSAK